MDKETFSAMLVEGVSNPGKSAAFLSCIPIFGFSTEEKTKKFSRASLDTISHP